MTPAGATAERSVRHLAIEAPSHPLASAGRVRLEDALRTATLPAGRLLLVRRLDLELADPRLPPSHLALAIERRMARLAATAVHGASPGAARASVVWFRDDAEPWRLRAAALASSIARGTPAATRAWFWPLALGEAAVASTGASPVAALRALLAAAGRRMSGRLPRGLVLRSVLETVLSVGGPVALDAVCDRADAERWAAVCGWRLEGVVTARTGSGLGGGRDGAFRVRGGTVPAARVERLAGEAVGRWSADDPRARLAVTLLLAQERSALALPGLAGALLAEVDRLLARAASPGASDRRPAAGRVETGDRSPQMAREAGDAGPRTEEPHARTTAPDAVPSPSPDPAEPLHPRPPTRNPEASAPADRPVSLDWTPTAWGGLFFLIHPLDHLGLGEALTAEPELAADDFSRHLLEAIARALEVPEDDGVWRALRPELAPGDPAPEPSPRVRDAIPGWHRRLAVWLDERTGLDLAACARRRGLVAASPTHLDLALPLSAIATIDLPVRRAGLDLDPGWVPWLGRVVSFHYVDSLREMGEVG